MAPRDRKPPQGPEPEIDARQIRDLARLLEETGLSEIEVEANGKRIRVARQISGTAPDRAGSFVESPLKPLMTPAPEPVKEPDDLSKHPGAVTSPMVGTVFLASDPGTPPFVKIGDRVTKGQTLLIIDAMKTMNPIPAPRAGSVARILVSNDSPVEYGQLLMIIE